MLIRFRVDEHDRLIYYGNPAGFIRDETAVVDPMFCSDELMGYLSRLKLTPQWEDGVYDRLIEGTLPAAMLPNSTKYCRVWQLKREVDVSMRFISYSSMVEKFGAPDRGNYEMVFDGDLGTENLEEIYTICCLHIPEDYHGHAMSMSDVVELYDDSGSQFYYCDRAGFRPIRF